MLPILNMNTFDQISVAAISAFSYTVGGLFIFRTKAIVERDRNEYEKIKYSQQTLIKQTLPHMSLVNEKWYPLIIRCSGIFLWIFTSAFDYLVLVHR